MELLKRLIIRAEILMDTSGRFLYERLIIQQAFSDLPMLIPPKMRVQL
jgi:hypothetical protein